MNAEFGRPQWQFGMSTCAFEFADRLISCFVRDGVWALASIDTRVKRSTIPTEFTDIAQVRAAPGRVVFIGGSPSEAPAVICLDLNNGTHRVLRHSFVLREDVRRYLSAPQPIAFPTGGGEAAHAFYYPPFSPEFAAPADERAPVLVKSNGGPTSAALSTLSLSAQYWTSRGVGVLDVNYRGSTGYGRRYRLRLEKQWGLVDVEDCVAAARWLVTNRNADPERLMISGGSAGRLHHAQRAHVQRRQSVQRGRELLRRQRPRGPRARHAQIRVPLPGLADWSLSTGQTDLCRTIPH